MNLGQRNSLDLCHHGIGEDDEICELRERLPEPTHTKLNRMMMLLPPTAESYFRRLEECNPGINESNRVRFDKMLITMGGVTFDAWVCDKDGKAYL